MAVMLEISVAFFFDNFVYMFGGRNYVQSSGGPIGEHITMFISRLVMQEWWEMFRKIIDNSELDCLMNAINVDDGRIVIELLRSGVRLCEEDKLFKFSN